MSMTAKESREMARKYRDEIDIDLAIQQIDAAIKKASEAGTMNCNWYGVTDKVNSWDHDSGIVCRIQEHYTELGYTFNHRWYEMEWSC